jgi:hypothetical protein
MDKPWLSVSSEARTAVTALIESAPPVLVEVRFVNSGTSPDWDLCEDEEELEQILKRLSPDVELYVSSVWDLKNVKGAICLRR